MRTDTAASRATESPEPAVDLPARAGGAVLASIVRLIAAVRRPAKPLHPHGVVVHGVVRRRGGDHISGVTWLDEPGEDRVVVRRSRAIGLPKPWPDFLGLALRIEGDEPSDLLLATTGKRTLSRFLLVPHREGHERILTSLLPYRSAAGPIWLAARRTGDGFELAWARLTGGWAVFASLDLEDDAAQDQDISFDPIAHPLPGLENYRWVQRLRSPAYRTARGTSGRST